MKKIVKMIAAAASAAIALVSCGGSPASLLPSVSGKAGEVLLVIDKDFWEGASGNAMRDLLACDCPYLFMSEPLYDLTNVTPAFFNDLFKVHRNIILMDISADVQNEGLAFKKDVWAHPQCVIQISAATEQRAVELVRENGGRIAEFIEQAERDRVIANTRLYEEADIARRILEDFDGSPHFPMGYTLKKITSDFVWVADEKQDVMQGVFVYRYPAAGDESDFDVENIIAHRNATLKENVPGMFDGTYMTTADFVAPTVSFARYKGVDFARTRGYWEVYRDYMGGPFVAHNFYSPDGKYVMVAEAFVYAPKYDKRQYLRQVESLLYSFDWKNEEK